MFPLAAATYAPYITWLAVIGIVYGAVMAYVHAFPPNDDAKKLVAYSSVSHLGFVVLGIFTLTAPGVQGGLYQMLAHGISTGGLFLGVGLLYDRRHTRKLSDFGGLWAKMPVFAALFLVITLASVGLPGLCGFIGEFMVLIGTFTADKTWAPEGLRGFFPMPKLMGAISASAVILAAMYLLTMYQKIFFGPLDKPENRDAHVRDVHGAETWVFGIVVGAALFMGFFPQTFLSRSEASVQGFLSNYRDRLEEARKHPNEPAHIYPALAGATAPVPTLNVAPKAPGVAP
jgi:NADH-quinone oxidoreductase subunit M